MRNAIIAFLLGAAALAVPSMAQNSPLLLPAAVEKDLEAKASNVTEVTLDKSMLGFASKFMDKKDTDQASAQQLIQGLDGIYVRDFEFDKDGQYSPDEIETLRKQFTGSDWVPMVHVREKKTGESTDVMAKMVNGQSRGMFILSAEPKELTIVLILGPIRMDQLGKLGGLSGLGQLGQIGNSVNPKDKQKPGKGGEQ